MKKKRTSSIPMVQIALSQIDLTNKVSSLTYAISQITQAISNESRTHSDFLMEVRKIISDLDSRIAEVEKMLIDRSIGSRQSNIN